jgi:hypothetical protein
MCEMFVKNSLLLSQYSLHMTNTVFPTFQTLLLLLKNFIEFYMKKTVMYNANTLRKKPVH